MPKMNQNVGNLAHSLQKVSEDEDENIKADDDSDSEEEQFMKKLAQTGHFNRANRATSI